MTNFNARVERVAVVAAIVLVVAALVNRFVGPVLWVQSTNVLLVAIVALLLAIWLRLDEGRSRS